MTDCAKCGDCCENIGTSWNLEYLKSSVDKWLKGPDPETDLDSFVEWMQESDSWKDQPVDVAIRTRRNSILNYHFVRDYWVSQLEEPREDGSDRWTCLAFDTETRLCTAHDSRPPVCSGYPWYGQEPKKDTWLHPRCSFQADIKTMLPIVEVYHGGKRV